MMSHRPTGLEETLDKIVELAREELHIVGCTTRSIGKAGGR